MVNWHNDGKPGLTFDDVLLRPAHSSIASRQDPNVHADIFGGEYAPIIVANMRGLATNTMVTALAPLKILVPAHRFCSIEDEILLMRIQRSCGLPMVGSVGLKDRARTEAVCGVASIAFLELAHADHTLAIKETKWIKHNFLGIKLVVGNIATADAAKRLFDAGADMCKVGVGPGSTCSTRRVTGTGVPQLSAVMECAEVGPIIADGGIKNSGDIVKALAAGATSTMIGSLFAGTNEAGGKRVRGTGKKLYFGMASLESGNVNEHNAPEGVAAEIPYAGPAFEVGDELLKGVRQGMAMLGVTSISDLPECIFQRITMAGFHESLPHILTRS